MEHREKIFAAMQKGEPMSDLISRQAAIETVKKHYRGFDNDLLEVIAYEMERLPSAQPGEDIRAMCGECDAWNQYKNYPQPGWIPCTPETMPEKTDTYLVQVGINKNGEGMHTEVRTAVWNVIWQKWYVHTTHCFVGDIIKWMPIPWEGGRNA